MLAAETRGVSLASLFEREGAGTSEAQEVETEEAEAEYVNVPSGWVEYDNREYDFWFSYPSEFEVLDGEEIGEWRKGVVVVANGEGAEELVIQVWEDEEEYRSEFGDGVSASMVLAHEGRYFSFVKVGQSEEVEIVVKSFRFGEVCDAG